MNNLEMIPGQKITVQIMNLTQKGEFLPGEETAYGAGSVASLRSKLGGSSGPSYSNLMRPPISTVTTPYLIVTGLFKM